MDDSDDEDEQTLLIPICIRTCNGRVGSTLLMQLLGTSEQIVFDRVYPYEHRHLAYLLGMTDVMSRFGPGGHAIAYTGEALPDVQFSQPLACDWNDLRVDAVRQLWRAFTQNTRRFHTTGKYYAEKLVDAEVGLLDAAGVPRLTIDLVRDPRDMVASIRAFDRQRGYHGFGRGVAQSESDYLHTMVHELEQSLPRLGRTAEGTMLVRYEDMAADLELVAEKIGAWLGLELDASAVLSRRDQFSAHVTTSSIQASVGRWHRDLAPAEARYMTDALAPDLERLGYG